MTWLILFEMLEYTVYFLNKRPLDIATLLHVKTPLTNRAGENFRGCLLQYPPKNLGQILAALAISGIFERFSPGQSGSEVGGPIYINSPTGPPTSEPLWPGENLSKMTEIARTARIWPKFFGGYWGRHPQKFSLARQYSIMPLSNTKVNVKSSLMATCPTNLLVLLPGKGNLLRLSEFNKTSLIQGSQWRRAVVVSSTKLDLLSKIIVFYLQ